MGAEKQLAEALVLHAEAVVLHAEAVVLHAELMVLQAEVAGFEIVYFVMCANI